MSFIAKLHLNEIVINLDWYQYAIFQKTNPNGLPSSIPVTQLLKIVIRTLKNDPFLEKMLSGKMINKITIIISPIRMDGKSTKLEFLDVNVLVHKDNFDGVNSQPMVTYIEFSYASLVVNGTVIDVKYWHKTDPRIAVVAPTQINQDEPEISEIYFENLEGNRIENPKIGTDAFLVLKTVDATGKVLDIDLSDKKKDFLHNGQVLKDDILKDIIIKSGTQKEKLTVIKQKK